MSTPRFEHRGGRDCQPEPGRSRGEPREPAQGRAGRARLHGLRNAGGEGTAARRARQAGVGPAPHHGHRVHVLSDGVRQVRGMGRRRSVRPRQLVGGGVPPTIRGALRRGSPVVAERDPRPRVRHRARVGRRPLPRADLVGSGHEGGPRDDSFHAERDRWCAHAHRMFAVRARDVPRRLAAVRARRRREARVRGPVRALGVDDVEVSDSTAPWIDLVGKVAVVTGGANGIGRGIVEALLEENVRVVIADIEQSVLDGTVAALSERGDVIGVRTDVSDADSVEALAEAVFERYGACHLLFNNAGVTSGGGGLPWEQESNDWKWCFGVNVFGVANGVLAFVPRMIASGEQGVVVNTSSGDGGIAPVPYASVYAASKAAISCFTESLAHQFNDQDTKLRAAVFYPSGGLMDTGLWTAQRNRPPELARVREHAPGPVPTFDDFRKRLASMGMNADVADL